MIELKDVKKIYRMGEVNVPALNGVSLKIKQGEFIAIKGPSGSGKSTLMNMVGCLDVPTEGKIFLDGKDISRMSESGLAQIRGRKIGFVFQKFNLLPTLTALENVTIPMMFQSVDESERRARGLELLGLVGLEKRSSHKPSELSGGQQQRVAIARSLANDPEVILADEPTGNLDTKTGRDIMVMLKKLHNDGKTIIMVTHDSDVGKHAKRIVFIKDGMVVPNPKE
ncbi:MAG: ABC transporter ATP-binding protein [Candidatus Aenigmarchaeota archaeon]|nr:ABC transporter ATP-binding protein [Candidatus Aenigmarchaeota archaeon]MCK5372706.1 ABC transporter ATP-binding protein [Candidatus Aenigmarchaeota archaeon]